MTSVSVICPVFNGERYLRAALESVVAQDVQPCELVVIDDGSTDASMEVVAALSAPFPVRTVSQPNAGQSAARNHGARLAEGTHLAFLDQDDVWYANHLRVLAEPFLEQPDLGFSYADVDRTDDRGRIIELDFLRSSGRFVPLRSLAAFLGNDMFVLPSASLVDKAAFAQVGGFDERLMGYEDDDLFLRIFCAGRRPSFVERSLSQWRLHGRNASNLQRMDDSRDTYAEKLIARFPDEPAAGLYWVRDCIAPRFFGIAFGLYHWRLEQGDETRALEALSRLRRYAPLLAGTPRQRAVRKVLMPLMGNPARYRRVVLPAVRRITGRRLWP